MATARPKNPNQGASANGPAAGGGGPRRRILRIGVLLGGKIVEERLIRERTPVSIGQSMRNTFSIPVEGLPLEFTLFALDEQGRYHLRILGKMDGRLSDSGGQVATLDALKGRAKQTGDYWQVPLAESSRGKLSLGDLTVLFQFVAEPPRQPKPMLPASVRGTLADRFDPRLSVIMGASVILHFAVVIAALLGDIEEDSLAAKAYNLTFQPEKYAVTLEEPKPAQPDPSAGSGAGSAAKDDKKPDKPAAKPAPNAGANAGRSDKEDVGMSEDEAEAMANLATGEGPNGTSEGDMGPRRPQSDLKGEIDAIREGNKTVGIGGGQNRGSRDGGGPRVGTSTGGSKIGGPTGPESAGGGKGAEKAPTGRITVSNKATSDDSTLTPDAVLKKIQQAYMAAITRCYTQYLKKEATARGAVMLSFTVNETGRLVSGTAKGFAGEVDTCIQGHMATWRFPVPKDSDNEATDASFQITLQLVPD